MELSQTMLDLLSPPLLYLNIQGGAKVGTEYSFGWLAYI